MNSTNVPSNKKTKKEVNNPAPYCGKTIPTAIGLEMPPKTAKIGNAHNDAKRYVQIGEIVISQAENCRLNSKDQLVGDNGDIIASMQKGAHERIEKARQKRNRYQGKEEKSQDIR